MAKANASEAAVQAAKTALQVHGAIGYTWEQDLHMWMKRAWALEARLGQTGVWHRVAASPTPSLDERHPLPRPSASARP